MAARRSRRVNFARHVLSPDDPRVVRAFLLDLEREIGSSRPQVVERAYCFWRSMLRLAVELGWRSNNPLELPPIEVPPSETELVQ